MRINTNMAALNAWRSMTVNQDNLQNSLARLSSGYRINRAADDAAGLAVSEKMRSQVRGINMAVRNAQDGVSLVQTAEGAAGQIQNMLQRMRELAVQSSSGSLQDSDRTQLSLEFNQLRNEIDRTSDTANFNGISLLKGNGAGFSSSSSNTARATVTANGTAAETNVVNITGLASAASLTGAGGTYVTNVNGATNGAYRIKLTLNGGASHNVDLAVNDGSTITAADVAAAINADGAVNTAVTASVTSDGHLKLDTTATGANKSIKADEFYVTDNSSAQIDAAVHTNEFLGAIQLNATATGTDLTGTVDNGTSVTALSNQHTNTSVTIGTATATFSATGRVEINTIDNSATKSVTVQVGANSGGTDSISLGIDALTLTKLGISSLDISSSSQITATNPLTNLDTAISTVSGARAKLGAMQNRLENAINSLQTQSENLTSADSRIRDVDMASEMANFTKYQVLSQASTAMLAQANQLGQGILSLLR